MSQHDFANNIGRGKIGVVRSCLFNAKFSITILLYLVELETHNVIIKCTFRSDFRKSLGSFITFWRFQKVAACSSLSRLPLM